MTLVKFKKQESNGQTNNPIVYSSPFKSLLENFFDDFHPQEFASFVPASNIINKEEQYIIELSCPGFEKNNFTIEVEENQLNISGNFESNELKEEMNYSRKEFNYGSFKRTFSLPENIDEDKIEAKYSTGILKIIIPKVLNNKLKNVKQIEIK